MTWRLAHSLEVLRSELDTLAPHRSKASDGTIGDASHAATASGHNPNAAGVVTAFDATHDPAGGCDIHRIVRERILPHPHPDLHYVISNGRIFNRDIGPWTDRPYGGADPHINHAHFSVGQGPDSAPVGPYDDPAPWGVAQEDDMYDQAARNELVERLDKIEFLLEKALGPAINEIRANEQAELAILNKPKNG